jgi:hypothetical protein
MDENRDMYVRCNRVHDNRTGFEFYRGGASPDPEVRVKENLVRSNADYTVRVEEGVESFALGIADVDIGPRAEQDRRGRSEQILRHPVQRHRDAGPSR